MARFSRPPFSPGQSPAGVAILLPGQLQGGAFKDDPPAFVSGLGAEFHAMVGHAHYIEVVFDDDHRVAGLYQPPEYAYQRAHVVHVKPDGWFVKDVHNASLCLHPQLGAYLEPLRLTAGERRRRLT
ncbi:hypothetical protein MBAV_003849 [Candidatus Magnetobacterium bavaricum]|uniref:Uncharacterized protein n=1 Tax=Candidatus Magnetobacterium bavaricum TaxID=29290 RepID=A0A0F3GPU9_9BACT|nr:hypothetical protein MBAV_003849 [Candidatus Magnetobacterium bavaricum]